MKIFKCDKELNTSKNFQSCNRKIKHISEKSKFIIFSVLYGIGLVLFSLLIFFSLKDLYISRRYDKFFAVIGIAFMLLFPFGLLSCKYNKYFIKEKIFLTLLNGTIAVFILMYIVNVLYIKYYLSETITIGILSVLYSALSFGISYLVAYFTILRDKKSNNITIYTKYANEQTQVNNKKYTWQILSFYVMGSVILLFGIIGFFYMISNHDNELINSLVTIEVLFGALLIDIGLVLDFNNRKKK